MKPKDHYCNWECPIGKQKLDELLKNCESVFDAAFDMQEFIGVCRKSCDKYNSNK